jgi:hypothetical protein
MSLWGLDGVGLWDRRRSGFGRRLREGGRIQQGLHFKFSYGLSDIHVNSSRWATGAETEMPWFRVGGGKPGHRVAGGDQERSKWRAM